MSLLNKVFSIIPENLHKPFGEIALKFQITTIPRICHFLAQVMHEGNNFKSSVEENLNYSAVQLAKTWKNRFAKKDNNGNLFEPVQPNDLAKSIERKPQRIANIVYANRMGNGSEQSGEGWKYRGRGYIQLTGKYNYRLFSDYAKVDFITNPDLLLQSDYAMLSSGWFWSINGLNQIADNNSTGDAIKKITKKINGGYNGLDDRTEKFYYIYKIVSR